MKIHETKTEAIKAIKEFAKIMKQASDMTGADFVADASDDTGMEYYVEASYRGEPKKKIVLGKEKLLPTVEVVRIHLYDLGL